jgi:uncharacterized protein (DUF2147 family)
MNKLELTYSSTLNRLFFLILMGFSHALFAQKEADLLVGKWMTAERNAIVECYKINQKYYGKIIWYAPFDEADEKRKIDPSENTKFNNQIIMKDFIFDKNEWNDGEIYDPYRKKSYTAFIKINSKKQLEVTGYILFRWLSQTMILNRIN